MYDDWYRQTALPQWCYSYTLEEGQLCVFQTTTFTHMIHITEFLCSYEYIVTTLFCSSIQHRTYNTQIVIVGITALYCNVETDLCTPALYSTGLYTATSGRPSLLRFHLSDCSSHTHTLPASRQPDTAPVPLISNSFLVKKYFLAIVIKQTLTTKLCSDDTWVTFIIIISLVSIQRIACLD